MRTFHTPNLPKDTKGRKIQLATVEGKAMDVKTIYKEAYRIRLNSRAARKLRRSKTELIKL